MRILDFLAGMATMWVLAGLLFRSAVNKNIPSEEAESRVGFLEAMFWPAIISGGQIQQ